MHNYETIIYKNINFDLNDDYLDYIKQIEDLININ